MAPETGIPDIEHIQLEQSKAVFFRVRRYDCGCLFEDLVDAEGLFIHQLGWSACSGYRFLGRHTK